MALDLGVIITKIKAFTSIYRFKYHQVSLFLKSHIKDIKAGASTGNAQQHTIQFSNKPVPGGGTHGNNNNLFEENKLNRTASFRQ